jgi:hypothetical protein
MERCPSVDVREPNLQHVRLTIEKVRFLDGVFPRRLRGWRRRRHDSCCAPGSRELTLMTVDNIDLGADEAAVAAVVDGGAGTTV